MIGDRVTMPRHLWEETLEINRRLHSVQRYLASGTVSSLRVLALETADDDQRGRLEKLIELQEVILATLDGIEFRRITEELT